MPSLQNDRLLKALARQPVDATPIWIMRQAGRYLPEYRALRKRHDFMTVCKTPELACEVALQPLRRFPLDAAIVFSDILTIPDAMGLGLSFAKDQGPVFARPLQNQRDIDNLRIPDMADDLGYVPDAVAMLVKELAGKIPVIGFSGSPWTLATYMLEGGGSKTFAKIKGLLAEDPQLLHQLLELLAETVAAYLAAQIGAGASAIMIFDTWGGMLSTANYLEFSLRYMQKIVEALQQSRLPPDTPQVPIILFTKNGRQWLESIMASGCDAISVDWTIDLAEARQRVAGKVALQGNMDPQILYTSPERIREEVARILDAYGPGPGHIFNLGHGITPDVDPERVAVLVDAVHEYRCGSF